MKTGDLLLFSYNGDGFLDVLRNVLRNVLIVNSLILV